MYKEGVLKFKIGDLVTYRPVPHTPGPTLAWRGVVVRGFRPASGDFSYGIRVQWFNGAGVSWAYATDLVKLEVESA